jgi:phosphatidylinositol alpha 1,6-mannosyltransferase
MTLQDAPERSIRPLRVALVTSSYCFIRDGVALTLNRLVRHLERQGVDVLVVTPTTKTPALQPAGTIVSAPSLPFPLRSEYRLTLGLTGALRRRLEAFAPDIVHLATPDFLGHQALDWAEARGVPPVGSFHTRYETYLQHYHLSVLEGWAVRTTRRFYQRCREVYVPSESMMTVLAAEGATNLALWSRGVDATQFAPEKRDLAWRRSLGVADDEIIVAFVSRLVREKRLSTIIETAHLLAKEGVRPRFLFVGEGPEGAALRAAMPQALFTGRLEGEALARAYASADIFLFPSDTETFGSVTLEAMASGLPTLCADATGSASLVIEGQTGYLHGPADARAFAERIKELSRDQDRRLRMGLDGRRRALEFDWDRVMQTLLDRYMLIARPA